MVRVRVVQLLYRSTGAIGQPVVNVTSVLKPPALFGTPAVVSYQSFYDSLNPADEPSYAISGSLTIGGIIANLESTVIVPALLAGEVVVVPDIEGGEADFGAGPEYGMNTLDSLRAALGSPVTGLANVAKIGLIGYSGGAIAAEWAAELAPTYAPLPQAAARQCRSCAWRLPGSDLGAARLTPVQDAGECARLRGDR